MRHQDRAEDQHQQQERQPDDESEVRQQRVAELLGRRRCSRAVEPVTDESRRSSTPERVAAVADRVDQVGRRRRRPGPVVGTTWQDRRCRRPRWARPALTAATPSTVAEPTADRADRVGRAAGPSASTTTISGPLKPGPEAVGEQVVGLALRGVRGGHPVVGQAEPQVERRAWRRCRSTDDRDRTTTGTGRRSDEARPSARPTVPGVRVGSPSVSSAAGRAGRATRRPAKPSSAGSSVSATRTATTTAPPRRGPSRSGTGC